MRWSGSPTIPNDARVYVRIPLWVTGRVGLTEENLRISRGSLDNGGGEMLPALLEVKVSRRRSYANGYKYCSRCRTYYLTDDNRCPYCRILLRVSPRKKGSLKDKKFVKAPEEIVLEAR